MGVESYGDMRLFFFFFQAEDGIRGAQESRGLGNVYKGQGPEGAGSDPRARIFDACA